MNYNVWNNETKCLCIVLNCDRIQKDVEDFVEFKDKYLNL
jgi:hypothetical protein